MNRRRSAAGAALGAAVLLVLAAVWPAGAARTSALWQDDVWARAQVHAVIPSHSLSYVRAGAQFACGLLDGEIWCWGSNANGRLGTGSTSPASSNVPLGPVNGALAGRDVTANDVGSGDNGTFACTVASGAAYCWGQSFAGQTGNFDPSTPSDAAGSLAPVPVWATGASPLAGRTVVEIEAGETVACALTSDGEAACWGQGSTINPDRFSQPKKVVAVPHAPTGDIPVGASISLLDTDTTTVCAIAGGLPYCWGTNNSGQVGNGTTVDAPNPVAVSGLGQVTDITTGKLHTCALSDGAAYCWGQNEGGSLGDGTTVQRTTPVPVLMPTEGGQPVTFTHIAAGYSNTCAITTVGHVYCWGQGANGQLGNGSATDSSVPVLVPTPSGITAFDDVTVGSGFVCATAATAVYCWGNGTNGELGNGASTSSNVPTTPVVAPGSAP
jgi:alpha-tubulin suppressor-like RCC1 family protein